MAVRYVPHLQIDFKRWDKCIRKSFNGFVCAYSWYLNIVSPDWDALIEGDYDAVMPLTKSTFLGYPVLVAPKLANQLGIFSATIIDDEVLQAFISAIPPHFTFVRLGMNKFNRLKHDECIPGDQLAFDLDLINPYSKAVSLYSDEVRNLLEIGWSHKLKVQPGLSGLEFALFLKAQFPFQTYVSPEEIFAMEELVVTSIKNKTGLLCGIYTEDEKLLGAMFFVWSHQKAQAVFHRFVKNKLADAGFVMIINEFIQYNSEKNLILRVETKRKSNYITLLEGVGAKKTAIISLYRNHLPWYLKYFL